MSEFYKIRTPEDAEELNRLYGRHNDGVITELNFTVDPEKRFLADELTIRLSLKGVPPIEIAFHGVAGWRFYSEVSSGFELDFAYNMLKAVFRGYGSPESESQSMWVLATDIEWRYAEDSLEK